MTDNPTTTGQRYINIYDGRQIEKLQCLNKGKMRIMETLDQFSITKEGHIAIKDKEGDIGVRLFNYDRVNMNVQSRKLLDMLLMKISQQVPYGAGATWAACCKVRGVELSLDEFMSLCELSDRKNAREQFRKAGECLFSIYTVFDYNVWRGKGKRRKPETKHFKANLFEATVETRPFEQDIIIDSRIDFRFGPSLLEYLCTRHIMPVHIKIFSINPHKHPHAYNLARHLTEVYRVKKDKGQTPRISVKTLLDKCPELPTVEEIKGRNYEERHYDRKIMLPLDRDLDALSNEYGIIHWTYCHKNGVPLTDEELANYKFEDWLDFMIDFTLPGYPERVQATSSD